MKNRIIRLIESESFRSKGLKLNRHEARRGKKKRRGAKDLKSYEKDRPHERIRQLTKGGRDVLVDKPKLGKLPEAVLEGIKRLSRVYKALDKDYKQNPKKKKKKKINKFLDKAAYKYEKSAEKMHGRKRNEA